jgi:hypothetical protein
MNEVVVLETWISDKKNKELKFSFDGRVYWQVATHNINK